MNRLFHDLKLGRISKKVNGIRAFHPYEKGKVLFISSIGLRLMSVSTILLLGPC